MRGIVAADSHRIVRETVRRAMASEGYTVVAEADNGMSALGLVRERDFDLLFLELLLPQLDGLELLTRMTSTGIRTPALVSVSRHRASSLRPA
jgi:two-component system response regulator EvgA